MIIVNNTDHSINTFNRQNLKQFVPKDLFSTRKSNEWEAAILKAHSTHVGKKLEDAQGEYLEVVKQWPFYGTTFYPPCKTVGSKKLPPKVIIGVNAEGILLLKKDKVIKYMILVNVCDTI